MLLRSLLLLTLLCAVRSICAQTDPPNWFTTYNPLILEAEEALLRHNPYTALDYYARAFAAHAHPHNADLYNAALAGRAANRPDLIHRYLFQLVQQGVPVKFVEDHFDSFYHPGVDWNVLYGDLLAQQHAYERKLNVPLVDCYAAVAYRELIVRTADPPPAVHELQDSLNLEGLMHCIATYGFPAPWQLGSTDPTAAEYPYLRPLLAELQRVHQTHDDRFGLLPLVDSLAREGTLDTYTYLELMQTQQSSLDDRRAYGSDPLLIIEGDDTLYRIIEPRERRQRYDANRVALGLRSYEAHTELRIRLLTGTLSVPYHLLPHRLASYPPQIADGLPLERVGTVLRGALRR